MRTILHVTICMAYKIKTLTHISRLVVHRVYTNTTKTGGEPRYMIWHMHEEQLLMAILYGMITSTYKLTTIRINMTYNSTLRIHIGCKTQTLDFWRLENLEFLTTMVRTSIICIPYYYTLLSPNTGCCMKWSSVWFSINYSICNEQCFVTW
jgi:hypothetical protein